MVVMMIVSVIVVVIGRAGAMSVIVIVFVMTVIVTVLECWLCSLALYDHRFQTRNVFLEKCFDLRNELFRCNQWRDNAFDKSSIWRTRRHGMIAITQWCSISFEL